jgi:small subunit ribosomal protein S17
VAETENETTETTENDATETAPIDAAADAPAEDADPTPEPSAADAPSEAADPTPEPSAAELRAAERQRSASARPARSPEDRQAERDEARRSKAAARRRRRPRERERAKARRAGAPQAPPRERAPGRAKTRQGVVTSDKADKTITVRIDVARRHRRYEKIVRSSSTLHAHDEANDAHIGDVVRVVEARPLSRTKRWRLLEVVERAR